MHCVICSAFPLNVTARSVEFGNISLATWIEHPVLSLISLIFDPPFPAKCTSNNVRNEVGYCYLSIMPRILPMSDPHWLAGTINRIGICVLPPHVGVASLNCEHHWTNRKQNYKAVSIKSSPESVSWLKLPLRISSWLKKTLWRWH